MTKVLIVEDQRMAQDNMEAIVNSSGLYSLAGIIANAAEAEIFCMSREVDLILMDVCTEHDESGIDAAAAIKRKFPRIRIIIVTSMPEHSFITRAREARADSFWYKDEGRDSLLDVMQRTMAGEHIWPRRTPDVKLGLTSSHKLSERELEVIRALMTSSGNEDAARLLGCTERNVRWHLDQILQKTGYRSRMELLLAVAQKNLIITTPDKRLEED